MKRLVHWRARRSMGWGWWLALAVLVATAPAASWMHAVLHGPLVISATAPSHHHVQTAAPLNTGSAHGIAAWFTGHDALDCMVLDQLSCGHSGSPAADSPPYLPPRSSPVWWACAPVLSAPKPAFWARGPPMPHMA